MLFARLLNRFRSFVFRRAGFPSPTAITRHFPRSRRSSRHTPCAVARRRAFLEPLEPRLALTGITASLNGNQLVVTGTSANDIIVIDHLGATGAEVRVWDNSSIAFNFASSEVASAFVNAGQ